MQRDTYKYQYVVFGGGGGGVGSATWIANPAELVATIERALLAAVDNIATVVIDDS